MALPLINISFNNAVYGLPTSGTLQYQYAPFQNLQNPNPSSLSPALLPLRLSAADAELNIDKPITIDVEVSYDDSVNLIVTDTVNPPKIINSRFYQTSSTDYIIADHKGNLDTNIYSAANFPIETGLIKATRTIVTIDFLGIKDGGKMPIGNYTFYFRLADIDGNESDFIAESGRVVCHIGAVNNPKSIRGGQLQENSNKLIKFQLNNLDLAYDYINIYYTNNTGDGETSITRAFKIVDKFQITNTSTEITITGYENIEELTVDALNIKYSNFDAVKSLTSCQNISFAGNIINDYSLFSTLQAYSLFITPQVVYNTEGIGNLDENYNERYLNNGYEYYNANNIYYNLGYWDQEIYRFGIVYILNDYTLSPVFDIRGRQIVGTTNVWTLPAGDLLTTPINYGDDYIIGSTSTSPNPENVKGVFKIDLGVNDPTILNGTNSITPIGIQFNFNSDTAGNNVITGIPTSNVLGLKDLTKGFFIVRQNRIPTILAQSIGIGTSTNTFIPLIQGSNAFNSANGDVLSTGQWFAQSFLNKTITPENSNGYPMLGSNLFPIPINSNLVTQNALLCPEASLRRTIFNSFFNSSQFTLVAAKFQPSVKYFVNNTSSINNQLTYNFTLSNFTSNPSIDTLQNIGLTLIEPGIDLINNDVYSFSSKAGDPVVVYKHADPILGSYEDLATNHNTLGTNGADTVDFNHTTSKVRGEFNTFIGTDTPNIIHGQYYNIFQNNYDFNNWKEYFTVRYNDSSAYSPVSDRISWTNLNGTSTAGCFRGDCYINTVTQRMFWNFIDEGMPTNHRIIDPFTFYKNFKVDSSASTVVGNMSDFAGIDPTSSSNTNAGLTTLTYKKLLPLFTYKNINEFTFAGDTDTVGVGIVEPENKKFKKYSEANGSFGYNKMNKPDINAVPLGFWITVKICSNINLAMRDLDFTRPEEEAIHKMKRGFYPYQSMNPSNNLPESSVINNGISKSLGDRYYFGIPDVPFIKTSFTNRIYYSNVLQQSSFTNGNRIFESKNYQDYTLGNGALVKLVEWYGTLIAVMEHGIFMIPVNERAMMANAQGQNVYINTNNVLPQNPKVLSNIYGSIWADSIIKTSKFIYGIDTVAKKIWRTNGEKFEIISDMKIQKFLNDHINLKETDTDTTIGVNFVKAHYNAFKEDILFVFKYNTDIWHLCWNELTNKWVTQYTWFPEFSENIDNIFYTFANQSSHPIASNMLYKHGFAGYSEENGNILPTYWYDTQYPFELEVIVIGVPSIQKIFNNLKIISNYVAPVAFYYEITGEKYDWSQLKLDIFTFTQSSDYLSYLEQNTQYKKVPYILNQPTDINNSLSFYRDRPNLVAPFNLSILRDLTLRQQNKTKECLIDIYQGAADINLYGRLKGNMEYVEDIWDVQIQPISFKYAYLKGGILTLTDSTEMKIRDKYLKVRIKYDGTQYAIISALRTIFTISYA